MDFTLSHEQQLIVDTVRAFVERELYPHELQVERSDRVAPELAEDIKRKDLHIGDFAIIEKAGEIIPAVVKVLPEKRTGKEKPFIMPTRCPVCEGPVSQREGEVAHRCENLHCPAQVKNSIRHFAARGAMDIEGLGEALVDQLVDADQALRLIYG